MDSFSDEDGRLWVPKLQLARGEQPCVGLGCMECARWVLIDCKLGGDVCIGQWEFPRGTQRRLPDGQWLQ